jgi:subtilase family serine protease
VSGTATAGDDYVALTGTVTIPGGTSYAPVLVTPRDDERIELDETVTLTLAADAAYTVGSPSSAAVTITSDDLPPDLVISSVTASSALAAGSSIGITDTTRNQGTVAAGVSETGFYLSANSTLDASDVFLGSRAVPALPAGGSERATTSFVVPQSTVSGTYYVVARADWLDRVEETNDANNTRASGLICWCQPSACPPPPPRAA